MRELRIELVATFRETFSLSVYDAGKTYTWREFIELVTACIGDTTTRLGAAKASWEYPATMADIATISANFGKKAEQFTPWGMRKQAQLARERHVSKTERQAAAKKLASSSLFRNVPGFTTE